MNQARSNYRVTIDIVGAQVDNRRFIGQTLKDLATNVKGLGSIEIEGFDP